MTFRRATAAALTTLLIVLAPMLGVLPASAVPPTPAPVGAACGPNEGVTVVVDFSPTADSVQVGCAPGQQATILDAMQAAGRDVTTEPFGAGSYLCAIDGVAANPVNCQAFPGAYWSSFLNTTDGNPGGPFGADWTSANVGVDGGPLPVGSVVGFIQNTDGSFPGPSPRLDLSALPQPDDSPVELPTYAPATGDAAAVAGWIGRQLSAGNGLLGGSVGLTTDAIYALAAAGVGGDQIAQSAAALLASGDSYLGAPAESATKIGQIAKTALALEIAGLDPTTFPGPAGNRDLLGELRAALQPDGSFGAADEPFRHAYAVLALSRTTAGTPASAVRWLQQQQCTAPPEAGSYGFGGCAGPDPDYTALVVQALLAAGVDSVDGAIADATHWLLGRQSETGDVAGNTNTTGLAGQAFSAVGAVGAGGAVTTEEVEVAAVNAARFVGGLQVRCSTITTGSPLTGSDLGAVAWKPASLADAQQFGIGDSIGEWQFAAVQAVFAIGTPSLGAITATGAEPGLPPAAVCEPTPTSTTPSPTDGATTESTSVSATTTAADTRTLSATGVPRSMTSLVAVGVLLVVGGVVAMVISRGRSSRRRK